MSRKTRLQGIFEQTADELAAANLADDTPRGHAGPVRSMALTLGRIEEEQRAILTGEHVVELDPGLIDESFVRDRLSSRDVTEDDDLLRSILENGQEVPILVREHPEKKGRYQVAYGHRRLRAAQLLDRRVKTIIRPLNDQDVVIAQGVENSARQNLSYIERSLFAHTLEVRGFERNVIMHALSTDKTELSKLISVARGIPAPLIQAIGPAHAIGRRRWMQLSALINDESLVSLATLLENGTFQQALSDKRFEMVAEWIGGDGVEGMTPETWSAGSSSPLRATIKSRKTSFSLALKAAEAPLFGAFITKKLDALYREFKQIDTGD